jgi:electron transport complex protein RnfG
MSTPDMKYHLEPPNSWHMIRALGGVGILCSLLIVFTFQATLPTITRNKAEALERAIFNVLPGASSRASFQVTDTGELVPFEGEPKGGEVLAYAGYDEQGRLVGVAMEAQGQGFQDTIRLIYGYSTEKQQVIGMEVLESKETPGLGDKIIKDDDFLANFRALDASLTDDGSALENPIEAVKAGKKEHPWQIDGITGATISSKAIGDILRSSTEYMLPILYKQVEQLKRNES